MEEYFRQLVHEVKRCYQLAGQARSQGLDPEENVPIPLAENMAERVVGLVSVAAPNLSSSKIIPRILELEQEFGALDWRVGFIIAAETTQQKFCTFSSSLEAMEVGIRVGFAYLTLGIVSAPLEGFIGLKIKKRQDGREYLAARYAGPIRGAGGTAAALSVVLTDYIRVCMGYAPYDPEEKEVRRAVTELQDYHERVTNLQYFPSEQEVEFMVRHLPVEVDGDPTEKIEVSNYKDLPRISTNCIRGGIALVIAEGLCQKAPKLWKRLSQWAKGLGLEWGWLQEFVALKQSIHAVHDEGSAAVKKVKPNNTFIMDLVAGRPIITHPMAPGGLRLRYGRTRTSGFSACALHPATLHVLYKYLAIGTQLKVERPGKGATVTVCSVLEGPIIRLHSGSVVQLTTEEEARQSVPEMEEVLFLGDVLFNYGDFSENGQPLAPAGYCPEWWALELEEFKGIIPGLPEERKKQLIQEPFSQVPSWEEAIACCRASLPLHPSYTYYWRLASGEMVHDLFLWLLEGKIKYNSDGDSREIIKLVLPLFADMHRKGKAALDEIGMPHEVINKESVVLDAREAAVLAEIFGLERKSASVSGGSISFEDILAINGEIKEKNGLEIVNGLVSFTIRDKAGTFVGARMGRPEKAKMREMAGSPQVLFPVGEEGDRLRSFQAALQQGKVTSAFPSYYCLACRKDMIYRRCEECSGTCELRYFCRICGDLPYGIPSQPAQKTCRHGPAMPYKEREVEVAYYFEKAKEKLGERVHPDLVKGIRGTSNKDHVTEHLAKGILRAKHSIYVNKDGTTRYDATELPITHFRPREIKAPVHKLRQLGYEKDMYGTPLENDEQLCELKPQDIILPGFDSLDESAPKVLLRVAAFIDELLEKFYRLPPYYHVRKEEDLLGHLVVALAPHISAGMVGRIIGFSETQGLFAHPMFHAGLRRDCVHPSTRFVYEDLSGRLFYEEIGAYVEGLISGGAKTKKLDAAGTLRVNNGKEIFAVGVDPKTKKIKRKKIKYFLKGPSPKKWVRITTATNRTLVMTPTHEFLHVENSRFKFKKAKDISPGDKVPLLNHFPNRTKELKCLNVIQLLAEKVPDKELSNLFITHPSFFRKLVQREGRKRILSFISNRRFHINLSEWYGKTPFLDVKRLILAGIVSYEELVQEKVKVRVKFSLSCFSATLPITGDLVSLLGYYAAEGHSRRSKWVSQVSFRVENAALQKEIIKLVKTTFSLHPNLGENRTKITICDQFVYLLFKYCFAAGSTAYEKKVPPLIFNLPDYFIKRYLSAFIDGDGSVVPQRNFVVLYSVSRHLLDDMALLLSRLGIFSRYHTTSPRLPGRKVLENYARLRKEPVTHVLHHLIISGKDATALKKDLCLKEKNKGKKLAELKVITRQRETTFLGKQRLLEDINDIIVDYVKKVESVEEDTSSYCLEIEWEDEGDRNILWGEQILNTRCDGDEAAIMLLMDALLNFSRRFLPQSRGSTMDAPLVLTCTLNPREVDDQVHGLDVATKYPLELYRASLEMKNPWEVRCQGKKVEQLADRLGTEKQYESIGFTHPVDNFNKGVCCSAYKIFPSMEEKLLGQMDIAQKVRAVDMDDVARLVIQKHFLRDIRGNLRKFSMQQFRCVKCNSKYRRPPLRGACTHCGSRLLFTITEGSVVKYLGPSLMLAQKYNFSPYLKETLQIAKMNIDHMFGKEKEKQVGLGAFVK